MSAHFDHYLCFGDSISIDDYAGPDLGAGSLLFRNQPRFWPEFEGRDLVSVNPNCTFHKYARDASTLINLWEQLRRAPDLEGKILVTVTIGGNDVLAGVGRVGNALRERTMAQAEVDIGDGEVTFEMWASSLKRWLGELRRRYAGCEVLLGSIYDPSDGTGELASGSTALAPLLPYLHTMNNWLELCAREAGVKFIDIHKHFMGNALGGEPPWIHCEIEPTQTGSSEVRRLFREALGA